MWLGIPYTGYGYNIQISRMFIFCVISCLVYFVLALPQTMDIVGNLVGFDRHYDQTSNDIYYLNFIHGIVFSLFIYLLLKYYNPYTINKYTTTNKLIQKKNIV